jgi:PAS domain S-box-containing protein
VNFFRHYLALPFIRQLYYGVIATALFSIGLSGSLVGLFYWNSFKLQVQESQNLRIHSTTQDIDNWLSELLEGLRYYAKLFNSTDLNQTEQEDMGKALLKTNWALHSLALYKNDTTPAFVIYQHPEQTKEIPLDSTAYYLAKVHKEEFISKIFRVDNQLMLAVTLPATDKNGNVTGVIRAIINLRYMQHLFAVIPPEKFGYSYILDENNTILADNFDEMMASKSVKPTHDYFYIMTHNMFKVYRGIDGKLVFGSKRAVPTTDWYMVIEYPVALILSKLGFNFLLMLLAFIGSLAVGILGARIIYKNISHPLNQLTSSAHDISRGNLKINLDTNAPHEFGQVARAFNTMSERLSYLFNDLELRLSNERLVSDIALTFIQTDHTTLGQNINQELQKIGEFTKASMIWIYYSDSGKKMYANRRQWYSTEAFAVVPDASKNVSIEQYPWLSHQLNYQKPFILNENMAEELVDKYLNYPNDVPKWADCTVKETAEYANCKQMNLKSQICLPLIDGGLVIGFIMLGYAKEREFTATDINMLSTLTNVIGTGIAKTRNSRLLMEEKERLAITLKSIGDAVIATNTDGIIMMMNPIAEVLTGWANLDAVGLQLMSVFDLICTDTRTPASNPIEDVIAQKCICNYKSNLSLKAKNSFVYDIELSAAPIKTNEEIIVGTVLVFRDITKVLETEREYFNIQKLEAVSYLSAGLAHDFNNMLFVIQGNITLALDEIPKDSKICKLLNRAQDASLKGNEITNQLLTFAKQGVLVSGTTDIISRIEKTMELLVNAGRAKVNYHIEPNLPLINMADGIVHQIITNLVINAMQSIKDKFGELTVNAELKQITESDCLPLEPGDYISLHIIDNGEGISAENLDKIFIPYFTTKATGTGLGLPTVFSLLTRYNGYIRINSQVGTGTDVEILFPTIKPDDEHPASV